MSRTKRNSAQRNLSRRRRRRGHNRQQGDAALSSPGRPRPGYVYCLANPAMPGKVKIGFTTREVDVRLRQLDTTGVAEPFEVAGTWLSPDPRGDERRVHEALSRFRVRETREFFAIHDRRAVRMIDTLLAHNIPLVSGLPRRQSLRLKTIAVVLGLLLALTIAMIAALMSGWGLGAMLGGR